MKPSECRGSGYLVVTSHGRQGRTLHTTKPINGKVVVYLYAANEKFDVNEKGEINCVITSPEKLEIKGFID